MSTYRKQIRRRSMGLYGLGIDKHKKRVTFEKSGLADTYRAGRTKSVIYKSGLADTCRVEKK